MSILLFWQDVGFEYTSDGLVQATGAARASWTHCRCHKPVYGHRVQEAGKILMYDTSLQIEGSSGDTTSKGGAFLNRRLDVHH